MEPLTQFVFKYATEVNASKKVENPKEISTLQNLHYDLLYRELADLKALPIGTQVEFLKRCGSVQKWYEVRHLCTLEALNIASRVMLKDHGFLWIRDKNPFERLLGHLFEQAIRNPKVTKEEIDQVIELKRQKQNKVVALKEKTLNIFERTTLRICYVWNYRFNLNQHFPLLNIQFNIPVVPIFVHVASYSLLRWYVLPRCIENYQPRGINFLINHLPSRTFPICFKIYDYAWWIDNLPRIPIGVGNRYPILYRSCLIAQKCANVTMDFCRIPVKIAAWGANLVYKSMDLAVPMLEKVENYSELVRYTRELNEVKELWIRESCSID